VSYNADPPKKQKKVDRPIVPKKRPSVPKPPPKKDKTNPSEVPTVAPKPKQRSPPKPQPKMENIFNPQPFAGSTRTNENSLKRTAKGIGPQDEDPYLRLKQAKGYVAPVRRGGT
jgi:hypothetical protein